MSPADDSRAPDAKSQQPLAGKGRRQSSRYGRPTLVSPISFLRPSARTMNAVTFAPRPFPPPSLADVPLEYIIDQLRRLAPHYWSKPETSDCTIVVPLDAANARSQVIGADVGNSVLTQELCSDVHDPRETARPAPRMIMKLHMDYLSAHSALLRGFLSGASAFELIDDSPPRPPLHGSDARRASARLAHDAPMLPSLLPSPPSKPTILLPVPDPASIRLLVHYIYFGCTSFIEDALDRGELSWEGLARNVEYLGLGREIKLFLGRWYRDWRVGRAPGFDDDSDYSFDSEGEDSCDPWSSDDEDSIEVDDVDSLAEGLSTATSATAYEFDAAYDRALAKAKHTDSGEPTRGRKTGQRRLGHSTSDPEFSRRTRPLDEDVQMVHPAPRGRSK